MKIYTKNGKDLLATYRNGKEARILIQDRPDTRFCTLTIDMQTGVIYYHIECGANNLDRTESQWDLI